MAFIGDNGYLASAMVGGNIVDIWAPPSTNSQVVLKPESSVTAGDEEILRLDYAIYRQTRLKQFICGFYSLAASKDPSLSWVAIVTKPTEGSGHMKLSTLDWKASRKARSFVTVINEVQEKSNYSPYLSSMNGM